MKANLISKYALLISLGAFLMIISTQVKGQEHKARLSVDYQKIMGEGSSLLINVKYKPEKKYKPASFLDLTIYQEVSEDSIALKGKVTTDHEGNAEFTIDPASFISDSLITYRYVVKIEGDENFKNAKKAIKFIDVTIVAEAIVEDSVHHISATMTDATGSPIEGAKLEVKVHRLFAPLTIGKSSYKTDDNGSILVSIEKPLPGVDGILTFEVMSDSRSYGIAKIVFDAPIGKVVTDQSTFDNRTMWSPPGKTPIFLLIFPNLLIFGIWIIIFILARNLFRIYKS